MDLYYIKKKWFLIISLKKIGLTYISTLYKPVNPEAMKSIQTILT